MSTLEQIPEQGWLRARREYRMSTIEWAVQPPLEPIREQVFEQVRAQIHRPVLGTVLGQIRGQVERRAWWHMTDQLKEDSR